MKRAVTAYGMTALVVALGLGLLSASGAAETLRIVKDRGSLVCGVSQGLPGFSYPDDKGNWTGLDVDLCRAISAAIFNDASKVKFIPLFAKDRFTRQEFASSATWADPRSFSGLFSTAPRNRSARRR
jgi:ABC-type amino acid transport substrate-binding protein